MGVPEGSFAIAAFIVVAIPGFIYAAVRRWARGESAADRDVTLGIARGSVFAVTLTATYFFVFGGQLYAGIGPGVAADALAIADPSHVGLSVLVFYVAIPVAISFILQMRHIGWQTPGWVRRAPKWTRSLAGWVRMPHSKKGYSSIPSAWDHSASENQHSWVAVRRGNGDWVGGWYTKGSFVTTYPEPRSIYINEQWEISRTGAFKRPIPGAGVFLMINDDDTVIWTNPERGAEQEEDDVSA